MPVPSSPSRSNLQPPHTSDMLDATSSSLPPQQTLHWLKSGLALGMSTAIGVLLLSAGIGSYLAIEARTRKDFNHQQQLIFDRASSYQQTGDAYLCWSDAQQIRSEALVFPEAQVLREACKKEWIAQQVKKAQTLADQGEYKRAIALLSETATHHDNAQVQELIRQFSQRMYDIAWGYYREPSNHFNQALAVLQAIPQSSPLYEDAQASIEQMQTEWLNNERHLQAVSAALSNQDVLTARQEANQVTSHLFWQQQLQPLLQTLEYQEQEQYYGRVLEAAQAALQRKEPYSAIDLVQQLPDTLPWSERKANLVAQAEADIQQLRLCQTLFSWVIDCYA
jgi:hypothetical protein